MSIKDISRIWAANVQRVNRCPSVTCFYSEVFCSCTLLAPKVNFPKLFHAMFWNVTQCVLFTGFECPLSTEAAVTQQSLCFLISPLCYWCSSASQITGLIVCTRCNYWSAGNLFGLERFFSVLVSAQLLLSSHVVNKWTLGLKKLEAHCFRLLITCISISRQLL